MFFDNEMPGAVSIVPGPILISMNAYQEAAANISLQRRDRDD